MEEKKFEMINDQELENVNGGAGTNYGPADQWGVDANFITKVCPKCTSRLHSMNSTVQFGRVEDGTVRKVVRCRSCGHSFYVNDDGDLIVLVSGD